MKNVYQFKKVVTYEVEASSYDEAVHMRNELDDAVYKDGVVDNIYEEETLESSKWVFTNQVPVSVIEEVIMRAALSSSIADESNERYVLTDKGRAYLAALDGKDDYDEDDYDEFGHYIGEDDIEDDFYDYLTN